jgi:hypothetical protein
MGNRGCLHGGGRDLGVTRWRSKLWICCVLDWKGVRRDVMPPNRWTALFFADEASALAAGHRPCAYCRRADYVAYAEAWREAAGLSARLKAYEMDAVLHRERVTRTRQKVTHQASSSDLPDGVMIRLEGTPALLVGGEAMPWSWHGYGPATAVPAEVEVLTPPSSVAAIAAGYRPMAHPSVRSSTLRAHDRP